MREKQLTKNRYLLIPSIKRLQKKDDFSFGEQIEMLFYGNGEVGIPDESIVIYKEKREIYSLMYNDDIKHLEKTRWASRSRKKFDSNFQIIKEV